MFRQDNHFTELKNLDIMNERITAVGNLENYVGKYFSAEYIKKHILHQTEDQIIEMQQQMDAEANAEAEAADQAADASGDGDVQPEE